MAEFNPDELVIGYADGGSRGNPGPAACGALLMQNESIIATVSEFLGTATNNVAEYTGLVRILEKARELGVKRLEVRMDSELVVKQMLGAYRVKNPGLMPLFQKARELARSFPQLKIVHVRREFNKNADRLANEALDLAAKSN